MTLKRFAKSALGEYLLCVAIAVFLSISVDSAFYVTRGYQSNLLLQVAVPVLTIALLFFGSYRRSLAGIIGTGVFLLLLLQVPGAEGSFRERFMGNPFLFYLLAVAAALLVFVLSRTRIGTAVLFVAGTLVLVAVQFLYAQGNLVPFVGFLAACGALFFYKGYQKSVSTAARMEQTAFVRTWVFSGLAAVLVVAVAFGAFEMVIKPLDPPTRVNMITSRITVPITQGAGSADKHLGDDEKQADRNSAQGTTLRAQAEKVVENAQQRTRTISGRLPGIFGGILGFFAGILRYLMAGYRWLILGGVILFSVVFAVGIKIWLRKRWLTVLARQSEESQVRALYLYYLNNLKVLGIERKAEDTLLQFMEKEHQPLGRFSVQEAAFGDLTETYLEVSYGGCEVGSSELDRWRSFYRAFHANCRSYLGNPRYFLKFFAL